MSYSVAGGTGVKRTLEGIATSSDGRYKGLELDVKDQQWNFWKMSPGQDVGRDLIWEFNMTTRKDQMIRFPTDCMFMRYNAQCRNKDFISATAAEQANKHVKVENYFLRAREGEPPLYFEGALGPASFIDRVEVLVNGLPMQAHQGMGSLGYIYQTQNKLYTSDKVRKQKYQRDIPRVSLSKDRATGVVPYPTDMDESMRTLNFDSNLASTDKVERFNMEVI